MSGQKAEIMLVMVDTLSAHPEAFQKYVKQFFDLTSIGGVNYYFAFRSLEGNRSQYGEQKGIAPSHSVHLRDLVGEKKDLFEWLHEKLADPNQTDIVNLWKSWDDGHFDLFDND